MLPPAGGVAQPGFDTISVRVDRGAYYWSYAPERGEWQVAGSGEWVREAAGNDEPSAPPADHDVDVSAKAGPGASDVQMGVRVVGGGGGAADEDEALLAGGPDRQVMECSSGHVDGRRDTSAQAGATLTVSR
jgi:hypothetical protein